MKIFAIVSIIIFFLVKAVTYMVSFVSRRGFVTDFARVVTMVLPVMSIFIYAGCYYMIAQIDIGFIATFVIAWALLIGAILVMHNLPYAFCYVTANNSIECYHIADTIVKKMQRVNPDIILDDNIAVSNRIRITYNKKIVSRSKMTELIDKLYEEKHVDVRPSAKTSLLALMVHLVEFIFDVSFLVNVSMG